MYSDGAVLGTARGIPCIVYDLFTQGNFSCAWEHPQERLRKLARVPLGRVKETPSGSLKNIIVERVDSIETTLAHVLPEFTANLLAPLAIFIYLCIIDWRMALASLISLFWGCLPTWA